MYEDLSYIDSLDLLKSTGVQNITEGGGELSFSCPGPAHQFGDRNPSARMNRRTTAWICHNCGERGNAVTFLAWYKQLPETVARRLLEERYGGPALSAPVGTLEQEVLRIMTPPEEVEEHRIPPGEEWLAMFSENWDIPSLHMGYMIEDRGFNASTLTDWEIGFDSYSERVTIPIRDHDGKLVGFKGRSCKHKSIGPKYMILGDSRGRTHYGFQPYHKSEYVYGLNRLVALRNEPYSAITDKTVAIVVEGELNVLAMNQHGYDNAVAIAGSEFSDTQRDLIVRFCDQAILFLDNDKSGDKGTRKVFEMLNPHMFTKIVQGADGDAADLDTDIVISLVLNAAPGIMLEMNGKL